MTIANLNAPLQTVLSGSVQELAELKSAMQEAGARLFMMLPVSAAFHSRFMEPARKQFEAFLSRYQLSQPRIPVISNAEALPYPPGCVAELLARQITSPVRWVESVQYLLKCPGPAFREVGSGTVLQNLVRQIST